VLKRIHDQESPMRVEGLTGRFARFILSLKDKDSRGNGNHSVLRPGLRQLDEERNPVNSSTPLETP
ncbi:MAG: hypothetical protein VXX55_05190, partial [Planctomycetota bacterium]|nr:hypothetical protein [Planctomycetota bacterium]